MPSAKESSSDMCGGMGEGEWSCCLRGLDDVMMAYDSASVATAVAAAVGVGGGGGGGSKQQQQQQQQQRLCSLVPHRQLLAFDIQKSQGKFTKTAESLLSNPIKIRSLLCPN